jgi:hypothetical protein
MQKFSVKYGCILLCGRLPPATPIIAGFIVTVGVVVAE